MGFNNGYESGYEDAKAELMPRIKALEAQVAGASSSTNSPGSGGGTAPGGVQVVEPTIDSPIPFYQNVHIIPGSASEIISITAEEFWDGSKEREIVVAGASQRPPDDGPWTISSVWGNNILQGGGYSYKFKIFWRTAEDPSSVARITETPLIPVYSE